jgi:DUF1680 family protein
VTQAHSYNIGGAGEGEMFKEPNRIAVYLTEKTAESCVSYNMLKLTRRLFQHEPDSCYMDYYERALLNHIVASGGPGGGSTYFMPLLPGGKKEFDSKENSCCHGTGLENHVKYQESIYFNNADILYVNLYISSELNWKEKGITIIQRGDFLKEECAVFEIRGNGTIDFRLRLPVWLREKGMLILNRQEIAYELIDGYAALRKEFSDGDKLEVSLPFPLRLEKAQDNPRIASLFYGPLVMVIDDDSQNFIALALDESLAGFTKTGELEFFFEGYRFIPMFMANGRPYHAYFMVP